MGFLLARRPALGRRSDQRLIVSAPRLNVPLSFSIKIHHHRDSIPCISLMSRSLRLTRPTIADLARAAGVSVATVDRVLNARHRVREPTAERVLGAAEAIGYHGTPLLKSRLRPHVPERRFAFLLQREDAFYAQFGADLAAATQ